MPRTKAPAPDAENPEWTAADFARAKPAHEALPAEILSQFKNTRQRGPQKAPLKQAVSIRLSPEVIDHFKADGPGWQSRIDEYLKDVRAKLFRRDDVPHREWVAFAFDYRSRRLIGFITYAALAAMDGGPGKPTVLFDKHRGEILNLATAKFEQNRLDPMGRALIDRLDVEPIEPGYGEHLFATGAGK